MAEDLCDKTPLSFKSMPVMIAVFTKNHPGLRQSCQRLEQLPCLPLVTTEVLFYAFHGEVECPDPACKNAIEHSYFNSDANPTTLQRLQKMQNSVIPKKPTSVETTPLDTESFNMDENQESPIDQINATTKMRHLETNSAQTCKNCSYK